MNDIALGRLPAGVLILAFCVFSTAAFAECPGETSEPGVESVCGIAAPEDLVVFADRWVLSSAMSSGAPLYVLDARTGKLEPASITMTPPTDAQAWGDPNCTAPAEMLSHGIDLSRRDSGAWQLLVVNHGGNESVEFFELQPAMDAAPQLTWRGCVQAPENAQFNDVAGLPDGSFLATDPITASWQLARTLLGKLGMNTGRVYRWTPNEGHVVVPGTEGAYPNGILLSPDGERFYLNLYLDGEVREHDTATGAVLRRVPVVKPDNSAWGSDGRLLVASHRGSLWSIMRAVLSEPQERNSIPFAIVAIDMDSYQPVDLFPSTGETLGGGTVAVPASGHLYIGAFKGDRMLRIPDPAAIP